MRETHNKLWLSCLDKESNAKTCDYWYLVTKSHGPHTAFRQRSALIAWLADRGLTVAEEIPEPGAVKHMPIAGSYRTHMRYDMLNFPCPFDGLRRRTLSNGDYVDAIIVTDPDGIRTVHTLNPNVKDRRVYDYRESEAIYC